MNVNIAVREPSRMTRPLGASSQTVGAAAAAPTVWGAKLQATARPSKISERPNILKYPSFCLFDILIRNFCCCYCSGCCSDCCSGYCFDCCSGYCSDYCSDCCSDFCFDCYSCSLKVTSRLVNIIIIKIKFILLEII